MAPRQKINIKDKWMDKLKGALPRKVNMKKLRPVGIPEASMQKAVENYLQIKGIRYIHIPSSIYRMCAPFSKTPIQVKKDISESLKGIPDLMLFKKAYYEIGEDKIEQKQLVGMKTLWIELKKKNAKARQSQIRYHDGLKCHVVDSVEGAIKLIEVWENE